MTFKTCFQHQDINLLVSLMLLLIYYSVIYLSENTLLLFKFNCISAFSVYSVFNYYLATTSYWLLLLDLLSFIKMLTCTHATYSLSITFLAIATNSYDIIQPEAAIVKLMYSYVGMFPRQCHEQ